MELTEQQKIDRINRAHAHRASIIGMMTREVEQHGTEADNRHMAILEARLIHFNAIIRGDK
jgi:hypothetical protein